VPGRTTATATFRSFLITIRQGKLTRKMPVSIEDLTERNVASVASMISRAFLASPVFAGVEEHRYSPEAIERRLANGRTLLAIDGDALLGSVTLFPANPNSPCKAFRDSPQVGLLAVAPEAGGRGIGSLLMDAIEVEAGAPEIALSVTKRGSELIAFYRRRGYEPVEDFHWPEALDPSLIMRKKL